MSLISPLPTPPVEGLARHHTFLRARLRVLGVAEANLDDAVQDVFEVLVRRMGDYDSRFSLRQWMAGVARKVAKRHREHERRAPLAVDETRLPAATIDPEHAAARQEGLAVLRRFLSELDAERWAVFVLSEIEGLRGTEIAAELDVNLSTVYARLRTARQAFEVAAAAQRGPGRSWLGALLVGPTSLFRRTGTAAFTTPLALCALATAGLGLTFGARACAEPSTEIAPKVVRPAPAPTSTPKFGTGILGRAADSARILPASSTAPGGPPVADAEGWFGGGSGLGVWSTRVFYKFEGADLVVRVEYENEGEVLVHTAGWIDHDRLDGFEIVGSAADRPLEIAVEDLEYRRHSDQAARMTARSRALCGDPRAAVSGSRSCWVRRGPRAGWLARARRCQRR